VITGTTSGLGNWAAKAVLLKFAESMRNGSCLLLLNRNSARAKKNEADLKNLSSSTFVKHIECDLQKLESVRNASAEAKAIAESYGGVSVLALNAGVMNLNDTRTSDGLEVQMQTNHLSHFLLTKLLIDALKSAADSYGEARIVTHSSLARHSFSRYGGDFEEKYFLKSEPGTLGGFEAKETRYHQTKLANAAFAMALAKKLAKSTAFSKIKALSCAPGISQSDLNFDGVSGIFTYWSQSAADGSCPLLAAMFGNDANSGDFYEPSKMCGVSGWPKKVFQGGQAKWRLFCPSSGDKLACGEASQELMWTASEKGLGEAFSID
jgi:NAD(P)-dependent dehydrogenase (short-subunit alcohol dehydrogenase family)